MTALSSELEKFLYVSVCFNCKTTAMLVFVIMFKIITLFNNLINHFFKKTGNGIQYDEQIHKAAQKIFFLIFENFLIAYVPAS